MLLLAQLDTWMSTALGGPGSAAEAIFRLVLAALAGAATGIEREYRGREAGFRTNMLVCLGSAMAMVVSYHVSLQTLHRHGDVEIVADPGRVAYGIMAGIGFLGAGAIIRVGMNIRGLTTAANVWCMAAVGLGYGLGLYTISIAATLLVVLVLWGFHYLEMLLPQHYRRRIVVRRAFDPGCLDEIAQRFKSDDYKVLDIGIDRTHGPATIDFALLLEIRKEQGYRNLERQLLQDSQLTLLSASEE